MIIGLLKYFLDSFITRKSEDIVYKEENEFDELESKLMIKQILEQKYSDKNTVFKSLLKVKKAVNKVKRLLQETPYYEGNAVNPKRKELEKDLKELWHIYEKLEERLIDVNRGLYMGIGINLLNDEAKKEAIYFNWKSLNSHMGVQGTTRTGKTVLMLNIAKQQILKGDNLIIIDPKGSEGQEVLASIIESAIMADRAKELIYYSPQFADSISDRLNVIYGMSNEAIASMLSKVVEGEQFFKDVVYKVTFAVCLAYEVLEGLQLFYNPDFLKLLEENEWKKYYSFLESKGYSRSVINKEKELYNPDEIDLQLLKVKPSGDEKLNIDLDDAEVNNTIYSRKFMTLKDIAFFSRHDTLVKLRDILKDAFIVDGKIRNDIPEELKAKAIQAINVVDDVAKQEKQFFEKTSTSLSTILTQLVTGKMGEILTSIRINPLMHKIKRGQGVICLIQSYPMLFKNISDMMVKSLLFMVEYHMGEFGARGVLPKRRLNILIDEAASVVYEGISNLFNKAGGLGTSLYVFTQSFADWEKTLGLEEAKMVMDNMNTQIRLRMNDVTSCEIVSKEFGTIKKLEQNTVYEGEAVRYMTAIKEEWLVPPEEVRRLPVGRALAKNDENIYLIDLPYYSGPKFKIVMDRFFDEVLDEKEEIKNNFFNELIPL